MSENADPSPSFVLSVSIDPVLIIPPESREQFLPLEDSRCGSLLAAGVYLAGWSSLTPGYRVGRPDPDFHLVLFACAGKGRFHTPSEQRDLLPGDLLIAPAHSSYGYSVEKSWEIVWFHLRENKNWNHFLKKGLVVQKTESQDLLALLLTRVCREIAAGSRENPLAQNASVLMRSILEGEIRPGRSVSAIVTIAHRLSEKVNAHLQFPWNVEALASEATLSERHLTRAVQAAFGEGPMQMVLRLRMERAAILLANTNFRVEDVATMVGYENPFAFSTAFKRCMRKSPREYRAR